MDKEEEVEEIYTAANSWKHGRKSTIVGSFSLVLGWLKVNKGGGSLFPLVA